MRKGQDVAELLQDPKKRSQMFYDKEYQEELEYLLPRMLHQGYFEQKLIALLFVRNIQ